MHPFQYCIQDLSTVTVSSTNWKIKLISSCPVSLHSITTMPKNINRKANYSLPESRFLVEKFKTHSAYFENNWTNGSRYEKTEVWQDIFDQYCEQFPHTDRTPLDIRRKLIKLRSEAKMIIQREQLKAQGANIQELLSDRTLKLSVSPAHRMMMKAMRGDEDWAAENGEFVEYEVEFEDNQDNEELKDDDDDDVEYVEDDEEDGENYVNPGNIIKKLFRPGGNPIAMATNQRQSSTRNASTSGSSEPKPKKRKHHKAQDSPSSVTKTTPDEMLCLQKQKLQMERKKLAIECDNLLLVQKKLQLEVMLLKQQVKQNRASRSSGTWDRKGRYKGAVFTRGPTKRSPKVQVVEETIVESGSDSNGQENEEEKGQEVIQEETEAPEENGNGSRKKLYNF